MKYLKEEIKGVTVLRCPIWVPQRLSGIRRLLHLLSFALSSFPVIIRQARKFRPDVIFTVEPTFFCIPGALISSRLSGALAWLHVQDFEIDAAFDIGLLGIMRIKTAIESIERFLIRRFDRVSTISAPMSEKLLSKGVCPWKRVLFPNWVDTRRIRPLPLRIDKPDGMRADLGIRENDVVVLYAGNMGEKQGLELLVDAAKRVSEWKEIRFVLCGDGASRKKIVKLAEGLGNMVFLPLQPPERLNDLLNLADIHVLPQKKDTDGIFMPSKLAGMLASGRPVVAAAGPTSLIAAIVKGNGEGERGIVVPPGCSASMADAVVYLARNKGERIRMGRSARLFSVKNLRGKNILEQFEKELLSVIPRH